MPPTDLDDLPTGRPRRRSSRGARRTPTRTQRVLLGAVTAVVALVGIGVSVLAGADGPDVAGQRLDLAGEIGGRTSGAPDEGAAGAATDRARSEQDAAEPAAAERAAAEQVAAAEAAQDRAAEDEAAAEQALAAQAAADRAAADRAALDQAAAQASAQEVAARQAADAEAAQRAADAAAAEEVARQAEQDAALDPRFGTCAEALAKGYGSYLAGLDPEYDWYRDADSDGIVCEA